MELGRSAHVAQAAGALLDRLEPELVAVEGARPPLGSMPPARPTREPTADQRGSTVADESDSRVCLLALVDRGDDKRLGE